MALWRFMDYCSPAGNDLIEDWYQGLSPSAKADFDTVLKTLAITNDWRGLKQFKMLKGGLGEIRFKTENVQYRPAGFFGPGEHTFSIYVGCTKMQNVYDPPNAFELARKRKANVQCGQGRLRERIV
jgi:hypothetical protein